MVGRAWALGATLAVAMMAGCLGAGDQDGNEAGAMGWPRCEHPWPCGDGTEWPLDLATPDGGYAALPVESLRIAMDDGVILDGAVWRPDVPVGTPVPVVAWVTPYAAQCPYGGVSCRDPPTDSDEQEARFAFLVKNGFAAALVSMRGTGLSGGCFDYYGARGQADMGQLVEALAAMEWSNGRVGMWGVSAMGTTPWMAAIEAAPALKAIAPSGIISDLYLNRFTPQGAPFHDIAAFQAGWGASNSILPALGALEGSSVDEWPGYVGLMAAPTDRLCPDVQEWLTSAATSQFTDDRRTFWPERRLVSRFADIEAAVLVYHGFQESGHAFQEDAIWPAIASPKRFVLGQWGHEVAFGKDAGYPHAATSEEMLIEWFDFWLKGLGDPPRLGVADFQDTAGAWHEGAYWPPDATDEVLHLGAGGLGPDPSGDVTFRAVPWAAWVGCDTGVPDQGVTFATPPLAADVLIAGNPMAFVALTSDAPGGIVAVDVFHAADDLCSSTRLALGAADLRFHAGNEVGQGFPTGVSTAVRVDLFNTAHVVPAGHRIIVHVTGMGEQERLAQPHAPTITISEASHLVLPLARGSLGGAPVSLDYPPRPFTPSP